WWQTWWAYLLYVVLFFLGLYSLIRWRTKSLESEKIELEKRVDERTSALNQSLENLKSTQSQLIHAEKMASLGELTAGIAHEIQNPLNFVNNFSEVNRELILEIKEAFDHSDREALEELTNDLLENEEKITHHGRRAESIVKNMLQHSRTTAGEKELIRINEFCDEYLRLAYHGMRARDKSFNAELNTHYAQDLPEIKVIPQEIGRVLLNVFNNAFQAVENIEKPVVSVTTRWRENLVEIETTDNGPGIPDEIIDKIFQPFFTTKPTGQGTGLGLSLSYDIVKAHGGTIKVHNSPEGGAVFCIRLPTG
ncbi:MAG TPA: ATP-binding protein, partial [Saprospiraceae bacterium]|nr:ATP-binding protein [Saprospiraceae bacterium]